MQKLNEDLVDNEDYILSSFNSKKWMSYFQKHKLFELTIPGTHNSSSYDLKHASFILSNRISCQ